MEPNIAFTGQLYEEIFNLILQSNELRVERIAAYLRDKHGIGDSTTSMILNRMIGDGVLHAYPHTDRTINPEGICYIVCLDNSIKRIIANMVSLV